MEIAGDAQRGEWTPLRANTAYGDYDNDGDLDSFAPIGPGGRNQSKLGVFRRNDRGQFADITFLTGLTLLDVLYSNDATWLDYDGDGLLDLYVASFLLGPLPSDLAASGKRVATHPEMRNRLYRNLGGDRFLDTTADLGLDIQFDPLGGGSSGGLTSADFDNDGRPDLYIVANGQGLAHLMLNLDGREFVEVGRTEIAEADEERQALAVGDVDNDGFVDVFHTSGTGRAQRVHLFTGLAAGVLSDKSVEAGLNGLGGPIESARLGDVDNDGDLDLVVADPRPLWLNDGAGAFDAVDTSGLIPAGPRLQLGDADGDGYPDVFFPGTEGVLFHNQADDRHWLRIELVGRASNRNGIGALVLVQLDGRLQMRQIQAGSGFVQDELFAHFGLGDRAVADKLEVVWPSGQIDEFAGVAADQTIRVTEGQAQYQVVEPPVRDTARMLQQNFPNPFNDGTTIRFALPDRLAVELDVYNLLGQRVDRLAAATLAAGIHRVEWNATGRAGGVYLYRLRAGGRVESRKLLLLR